MLKIAYSPKKRAKIVFFFKLTKNHIKNLPAFFEIYFKSGKRNSFFLFLKMTLASVYARKYGERQSPASGSKQQKTSFMGVFFVLPPSAWTRTAKGLPQISNLWEGASDA